MINDQQAAMERLRTNNYAVIHGRLGARRTMDGRKQRDEDLEAIKDAYLAEHTDGA